MTKGIKLLLHTLLALCLLVSFDTVGLHSQTLIDNTKGMFNNDGGTIKFRQTGSLRGLPDTLGGTVMFLSKNSAHGQIVPNITWKKLIIDSYAWLTVDSMSNTHAVSRPMSVLDSFIISSGDQTKLQTYFVETHAKSHLYNNGKVWGTKDVVMKGEDIQTINGDDKGSFSRLRIENKKGVEVVGSFTVDNKLELKEGELKNDKVNFKLGNSQLDRKADTTGSTLERPLIVRHSGSSVTVQPDLQEPGLDIHYKGEGTIHTGAEIPKSDKSIVGMRVENSDSLVLTQNIDIKDNLYVGTHIHTEKKDTLTLSSVNNPEFHPNNTEAEVHGNFRRTGWKEGDTIVFNNPMTRLVFHKSIDRGELSQLVSTIYPGRYSALSEGDRSKVKRQISLRGLSSAGNEYVGNIDATYGYGWRYKGNYDETYDLAFDKLALMQYTDGKWVVNTSSVVPATHNKLGNWGYSYANSINSFGDFAIGINEAYRYLAMRSKALLEGAYRIRQGRMSNELQEKNYLPMPPPDIYPYNTDPNRAFYVRSDGQFPDSVVDWVVLEFRKDFAIEGYKKTLLLKTDGRLVDLWGNEQVLFDDNGKFLERDSLGNIINENFIKGSQMYVLLRHRNHAAVISDKPVQFEVNNEVFVDFTLPETVLGGANSLKPVDRVSSATQQYVYAMLAGDINKGKEPSGLIDAGDYDAVISPEALWTSKIIDGYLLEDINLSGTITTMDFNLVFNNRNRMLWYHP